MKCRNCLITDSIPGVIINSDKTCNYCTGEKRSGIFEDPEIRRLYGRKKELRNEFENLIRNTRGSKDYDCLLPLSGGKDSAYLLYYLHRYSKLRMLAVTFNTGFESDIALGNVKNILKKIPVNHLMLESNIETFKKLFRYFLLTPPPSWTRYLGKIQGRYYMEIVDSNKESAVSMICRTCTLLWQSILLRTAKEHGIPLVFLAYSPDQIGYYFYRIPGERIAEKNWYPGYLPKDLLAGEEKKLFWNEDDRKNMDSLPSVIFPLHVFEDYSVDRVRETLHKEGILFKNRSSQFATNCKINWLMMYRDLNRLHYNPYLESYSYLIRNKKLNRARWRVQFAMGNFLIKNGLFPRRLMKSTLKELGITFKDLKK